MKYEIFCLRKTTGRKNFILWELTPEQTYCPPRQATLALGQSYKIREKTREHVVRTCWCVFKAAARPRWRLGGEAQDLQHLRKCN